MISWSDSKISRKKPREKEAKGAEVEGIHAGLETMLTRSDGNNWKCSWAMAWSEPTETF